MAGTIEQRLIDNDIELPEAASPVANYVPAVRSGSMLYISGQVTLWNGQPRHLGKLGAEIDAEEGQAAARICALNIVAQAKAALGDLDRVARVVKLVGFVNSAPGFTDQPKVVNGASDLMVEVFGDKGRHARSAVGVASLPLGVSVEVEAILEVAD